MRSFLAALLAVSAFGLSASAQTVVYAEDFESGYSNWSMTGLWNEQASWESCTTHLAPFPSGTHCAWYGAASPCNISPPDWGDHYLTQLQSTVLPATTGVIELRFRSHLHAEEDGIWDLREVEVSTDDGATWSKTGDVFNSGFGWRYEVCDLTRFAGSSVRLRFRFWAGDSTNNAGIGWLVDDIRISERDASAVPNCLGDGSMRNCPCFNQGATGRGCATSFNPAGAGLTATGYASVSADTLVFSMDGMSPAAATILQGSFWTTPFSNPGGDGWICLRAPFARIRTLPAPGGAATYPLPGEVAISVRGGVPATGGQRFYSVRYRNAASFCTTSTFNATNGLSVTWRP